MKKPTFNQYIKKVKELYLKYGYANKTELYPTKDELRYEDKKTLGTAKSFIDMKLEIELWNFLNPKDKQKVV